MGEAEPFFDSEETQRALLGLLKRLGVQCADEDVVVHTTHTRRGHTVHIVMAFNSAESALASMVARVASKRNSMVGVPGVFVLRPDDVDHLVGMRT